MVYEDEELVKLFVEESLEHLVTIGNDLLKIEESGDDLASDLVNRVFRAIHSIKGGIGIMNLANIEQLAHCMETVIGKIRDHEIKPDTEVVNVLLLATDNLKNLLLNIEVSNSMDVSENIQALQKSISRNIPKSVSIADSCIIRDSSGNRLFGADQNEIERMGDQGQSFFLVAFHLKPEENPGLSDLHQFLNGLQKCGHVIDCQFDAGAVGCLSESLPNRPVPFAIFYTSSLEVDIIRALSEIRDTFVYQITIDDIQNSRIAIDYPLSMQLLHLDETDMATQPNSLEHGFSGQKGGEAVGDIVGAGSLTEAKREVDHAVRKYNSLRVSIDIIDNLMNLAAEFVLGRNQLLQSIGTKDWRHIELAGQRIDSIATKLQETVMLTRLQPIGTVFNKFPRIVRDLAGVLDKKIKLSLNGESVELDKTILEAIGDPLTHMVRNAIDHGIEPPEQRRQAGKSVVGNIQIRAFHEAGQVCIEIRDDGRGIDGRHLASLAISKNLISMEQAALMSNEEKLSLIFLPGFSTSDDVTALSGRGVGMDVVKSNLDKLGGIVNIHSHPGRGTVFLIKLPLTLAIIPSQIVMAAGQRYAIPQVSLDELIGIPPEEVKFRIEKIGNASVLRVRESLIPLIRLVDIFKIENDFYDNQLKAYRKDRRNTIVDRRAVPVESRISMPIEEISLADEPQDEEGYAQSAERRNSYDRRYRAESMVHIVIVTTGALRYGIIVDKFHDPEEIVVKPLGRHFNKCQGYAGATIMGDGRVALIIDVLKLAQMADLVSMEGSERAAEIRRFDKLAMQDFLPMLLFRGAEEEYFTVPLGLVDRIEKIERGQIETIGGRRIVPYKGHSLVLYTMDDVADVNPIGERNEYVVLVFSISGNMVGLMARTPVDAVDLDMKRFDISLKQPGIMGSLITNGHTTMIVDILEMLYILNPDWQHKNTSIDATVLLVDDTEFSRMQVRRFLTYEGFQVIEATDGVEGLEALKNNADLIKMVITDLNMPNLDGFMLSEKMKMDQRFENVPILALTNGYSEEEFVQCGELGVDAYHVNFDRSGIVKSALTLMNAHR